MKSTGLILGLVAITAIAACDKDERYLPGEREEIRSALNADAQAAAAALEIAEDRSVPVRVAAARSNKNWTQRSGTPDTRTAHPALAKNLQLAWSVDIGAGDGKRNRIISDPVVADGRVFTLDAQSQVTAVSTSGAVLWTHEMRPETDGPDDAGGGGLAYGNGTLYVTSGFGLLTAYDPASGKVRWQQNLQATGTGHPTVSGDLVYLVAGDDVAWAIEADTGRIRWRLGASPDINNVLGGPAPAVAGKFVIFAFGSGDIQAAFRKGGLRMWDTQVAGQRTGFAAARIADITGDPVVVGDEVYIGNHSGRTVAMTLNTGRRLWTAPHGSLHPIWPAGNSLFLVSDRNQLIRLSRSDGRVIWSENLPFFTDRKPKKQSEIYAHHGPVLAGGRLIIASSDGKLRHFDPVSGAQTGQTDMPGGATSNPVVAGGALYVVTEKGQLLAFR